MLTAYHLSGKVQSLVGKQNQLDLLLQKYYKKYALT